METIDEIWKWSSEINQECIVERITDYVSIARNVYKYPDRVLEFQELLCRWETWETARPGMTSLVLPAWLSKNLIEEVFDMDDSERVISSCEPEFLYFYRDNIQKHDNIPLDEDLQTGNCLLPHNDYVDDNTESIIFLVNLNHRTVKTGFWSFNEEVLQYEDTDEEVNEYARSIDLHNYHEKTNNGILDNVLNVEYNFNEAIVYNARALHQPWIDDFYTRQNPRIMLRFPFDLSQEELKRVL